MRAFFHVPFVFCFHCLSFCSIPFLAVAPFSIVLKMLLTLALNFQVVRLFWLYASRADSIFLIDCPPRLVLIVLFILFFFFAGSMGRMLHAFLSVYLKIHLHFNGATKTTTSTRIWIKNKSKRN